MTAGLSNVSAIASDLEFLGKAEKYRHATEGAIACITHDMTEIGRIPMFQRRVRVWRLSAQNGWVYAGVHFYADVDRGLVQF